MYARLNNSTGDAGALPPSVLVYRAFDFAALRNKNTKESAMNTKLRATSIVCLVAGAVAPVSSVADPITYTDWVTNVSIILGSRSYSCPTLDAPTCVAVLRVTATGDTSTIQAFNIPGGPGFGARGYINSLTSVSLQWTLNDGQTLFANLLPSQLTVAVDQTNQGAGFGSVYGSTYPAATYGNAAFASYDLASNFDAAGFTPFIPSSERQALQNGGALTRTTGEIFDLRAEAGPTFGEFASTVTSVPEPSSSSLFLAGLGLVAWRWWRRLRAAC
jgi:hypothetical protein